MGRQKKTKKIKKTTELKGTQNLGYQGKVTIKLVHGDKIISTKTYHNSGLPLLFKFLGSALAGNYSEDLRPTRIKLFYWPGTTPPETFDWDDEFSSHATKPQGITPFINYDNTPNIIKVEDEKGIQYQTTLHFRVPFAVISGEIVHLIGLYPCGTYQGREVDASAYYLFTNEKGNEWEPLIFENTTNDFSLIIDWTMAVMNK